MKKEIVEKAMKMLPDVKAYCDDIIIVRILRFLPDNKNSLERVGFLYYTVKYKKGYRNGRLGWQYVSSFADRIHRPVM